MKNIDKIISDTKALSCLDCGKCTAACAVSRYDPHFSPRLLVNNALRGTDSEILKGARIWQCLTCTACETICTSGVKYWEFIRSLRSEATRLGSTGQCTHGGALQALMHIMSSDEIEQHRLDWVPKQLQTTEKSDTLYFVGCAPYFEAFFANLEVKSLRAAKGSIALLNRMGIVPALLPNERCCGHDLLNSGDVEGFLRLARQNVKEISQSGAKRVVVSCPEGYHTLKVEYPRYLGNSNFEVVHLTQLLADAVRKGDITFSPIRRTVVYHDSCRLGRISGIYDEPRAILKAIPELRIKEMRYNRATALCCGTQSWINCGTANRQIQAELLREAEDSGADLLLTSCPKCRIHLKCAMCGEQAGQEVSQIETQDFYSFVGTSLAR